LFSDYSSHEKISIKELAKIFEKKLEGFPKDFAEILGRYLIEPRDTQTILYNQYLDKNIVDVRIKIDSLLSNDYPKDFHIKLPDLKDEILNVFYYS